MVVNRVPDDKGGSYIMMTSPDVERVNPVDYYSNWHMTSQKIMLKEGLWLYRIPFTKSILNKLIDERVMEEWRTKYEQIKCIEIPDTLKKLIYAKKKKHQEKLLRGLSITPDILIAFLFYAWEEHGFTFSQYKSNHQKTGLNAKDLPTIVHVDGDKVESVGKSELSDGELKQSIQHRTIVVAKFIEKEDNWHCLFTTFNSLKGEENWNNGQPHFHYISSKFGISRENVIKSLKQREYKLGSLPHIKLLDYGNQPE